VVPGLQLLSSVVSKKGNPFLRAARVCLLMARGILVCLASFILSPVVLLADLLTPGQTIAKRWVIGYLAIILVVTGVAIAVSHYEEVQTNSAMEVLNSFYQRNIELDQVPFGSEINMVAVRVGLDPALIASVVEVESDFRPEVVSPAGAKGLMQIMPATWRELNPGGPCDGRHPPPAREAGCIFDPLANLDAGARYLKMLLDHYNGDFPLAFAAYNAGMGNVARFQASSVAGIPPFIETRDYVASVLSEWLGRRQEARSPLVMETVRLLRWWDLRLPWVTLGLWLLLLMWVIVKLN